MAARISACMAQPAHRSICLDTVHWSSSSASRCQFLPTYRASQFSTSLPRCYPRDRNRLRSMSAIKGSGLGPSYKLSVTLEDLPIPVDSKEISKPQPDQQHGLWGFFNKERTVLSLVETDSAHGREWSVEELRRKSWTDLHSLWWVCVMERNRLATEALTRERLKAGYGKHEASTRDKAIRRTMRAIKHTLTERWYAWEDARQLADSDPEINQSGSGPLYRPIVSNDYLEEHDAAQSNEVKA
ncbi:MRP-L47-domain-containing protein [Trichodelitschia bisporula]|uniref:Large ribosomal subunit protein uL29m n=1 Tax=Trichodelitschia bisporula TaxID=703511 RepID=A0A6G1HI24_9PEZI|nr:MRP-L47-domain-containing protein [Trichodelitschia bisporula]